MARQRCRGSLWWARSTTGRAGGAPGAYLPRRSSLWRRESCRRLRSREALAGARGRFRREARRSRNSWLGLRGLPESLVESDEADDRCSLALHALILRLLGADARPDAAAGEDRALLLEQKGREGDRKDQPEVLGPIAGQHLDCDVVHDRCSAGSIVDGCEARVCLG